MGSGEKLVAVCYFEAQNNFWVSKHAKKHGSSVLCVAWSPSAVLLATGCADSRGRVMSAYVKGVDRPGKDTPFGADPAFGTILAEYPCAGWVHSAAWHPNGTTVAFASHDSRVTIVSLLSPGAPLQTIRLRELPIKVRAQAALPLGGTAPCRALRILRAAARAAARLTRSHPAPSSQALTFMATGSLIGVGFSYTPLLFRQIPGTGTYSNGEPLETADRGGGGNFATSAVSAAMRMFQAQDKAGQEQAVSQSAKLASVHQNCVTCIRAFDGKIGGRVVEFTTTGLDGCLVFWTSEELASAMKMLSVSR